MVTFLLLYIGLLVTKLLSKFNPKSKVLSIGVARIFDWGAQTTNHMQRRHQNFSKEKLSVKQRYRRTEDQKPCSGLALNHYFAKGRRLKPSAKIS